MPKVEIDATELVRDAANLVQRSFILCRDCGCVTLNGIPCEIDEGVRCAPCFATYHYANREEWLRPIREFSLKYPEAWEEGCTIAHTVSTLCDLAAEALDSRQAQKDST